MTDERGPHARGRIALVGFMGAGKSAVGETLAELLGWRLLDTDREVERAAGRSIRAIFDAEGESAFRELEAEIVKAAVTGEGVVMSLGGGAFTRQKTRELVLAGCEVVYLRARAETLWARISRDSAQRPLADAGFPEGLFEARRAHYELAHLIVDTDDSTPEEVARRILAGRHGPRAGS